MMPLGKAEIVGASISSVEKSSAGKAGSLNGYFTDKTLGTVTSNTGNGIFGTIIDNDYTGGQKAEIASFSEIKPGDAQVITTLNGEEPKSYDLKITAIRNDDPRNNENFVIKVTDICHKSYRRAVTCRMRRNRAGYERKSYCAKRQIGRCGDSCFPEHSRGGLRRCSTIYGVGLTVIQLYVVLFSVKEKRQEKPPQKNMKKILGSYCQIYHFMVILFHNQKVRRL